MPSYSLKFFLPLALSLFLSGLCQASPNYVASVIEFGESFESVAVADINGDQLKDLIVSNWNENQGRELWLYWQQADGKFPAQASRKIEIKRDIVAYALADIRHEPGDEFLFFTAASIYSYSATHDGYANNLQKLIDWVFVSAVPSQRSTAFLGRYSDEDGDSTIDILIPGRDTYGLLSLEQAGDNNKKPSALLLPQAEQQSQQDDAEGSISINTQDGFKIEVVRPSDFEGLIVERLQPDQVKPNDTDNPFSRYTEPGFLLSLERWINNVQMAQLLPGPKLEYLFVDEVPTNNRKQAKQQRINIVTLNAKGSPTIHYQGYLDQREQIKLFDFNDDGLVDVLANRIQGTDNVSANIYLNRNGSFNLDKADQIIKFSGYDVNFRLGDINRDGHSDLILGAYQISAVNALRSGALVRVSLIYSGNPNFEPGKDQPLFSRRPDFKLEESFSADDIKGLTEPVDYTPDIDGDGINDAIAIDKRGALTAKAINAQFQLQSEAFWDFVPLHFIQQVNNYTLNLDERPDFVLRHQSAVTVLVSR